MQHTHLQGRVLLQQMKQSDGLAYIHARAELQQASTDKAFPPVHPLMLSCYSLLRKHPQGLSLQDMVKQLNTDKTHIRCNTDMLAYALAYYARGTGVKLVSTRISGKPGKPEKHYRLTVER